MNNPRSVAKNIRSASPGQERRPVPPRRPQITSEQVNRAMKTVHEQTPGTWLQFAFGNVVAIGHGADDKLTTIYDIYLDQRGHAKTLESNAITQALKRIEPAIASTLVMRHTETAYDAPNSALRHYFNRITELDARTNSKSTIEQKTETPAADVEAICGLCDGYQPDVIRNYTIALSGPARICECPPIKASDFTDEEIGNLEILCD